MSSPSTPTSGSRSATPEPSISTAAQGSPALAGIASSSSARRRHALREFYRLQAQAGKPADIEEKPADEDMEELLSGGLGKKSDLDRPGVSVDEYIRNLVKTSDLKTIVKRENELVMEIRALDSEQKALVYNNYHKLISAANALDLVSQRDLHGTVGNLKSSLSTVRALMKKTGEVTDSKEAASPESANVTHSARWLLMVNSMIDSLVSQGLQSEARSLATETLNIVKQWPDSSPARDHLELVKAKMAALV